MTQHHLVPQSWWRRQAEKVGRNNPANIIPLCTYCHAVLEGHLPHEVGALIGARREDKRRTLRALMLPEEIEFVISVRGQQWLDHHYPLATERHGSY